MDKSLLKLNNNIPGNPNVEILKKKNEWIKLSPLVPQLEPENLGAIKNEVIQNWDYVCLLDFYKEVDYRVNFTKNFRSVGQREILDRKTIQKRLLLTINERYQYWNKIKLPHNIPLNPHCAYRDKGRDGWKDFLGTGNHQMFLI